jgi:spermidine synthase
MKVQFIVLTLVISFVCMTYELLLAQTTAALLGNTLLRYSVVIGLYIFSLGLGSFLVRRQPPQVMLRRLFSIEIGLLLLGGMAPVVLIFTDFILRHLLAPTSEAFAVCFQTFTYVYTLAVGILSGMELPILIHLGEDKLRFSSGKTLALDYLGTLAAVCLFAYWLLPAFGTIGTAAVAAGFSWLGAALTFSLQEATHRDSKRLALLVGLLPCVLILGLFNHEVSDYLSSHIFMTKVAK